MIWVVLIRLGVCRFLIGNWSKENKILQKEHKNIENKGFSLQQRLNIILCFLFLPFFTVNLQQKDSITVNYRLHENQYQEKKAQ